MQSETVIKSRRQQGTETRTRRTRRSSRPRTEYAFDVNTNEIRCDCQRRQAHRKSRRESQLHGEKHPHREKLEDKFARRQG